MGSIKKALVGAAVLVGVCAVAKRLGSMMFEHMSEEPPPKWMFRNIAAIPENTDRILEFLERERPSVPGGAVAGPSTD